MFKLKLEPVIGSYVSELIKEAKDIAKRLGLHSVYFEMNGINITVKADSVIQDVVDKYYKRCGR